MEWAHYLSKGVQEPVYHMCDAKEFAVATVDGGFYYSPTFKDDKFIHATADPQHLLEAGNHFYKVSGVCCLEHDAIFLRSLDILVLDIFSQCICGLCTLVRRLHSQFSPASLV
jgi:hypothetical protein